MTKKKARTYTTAPRPRRLFDGDTFTLKGLTFTFQTERDDQMGEPWKEHDGHGPVSEWTTRKKRPGERVLNEDRGSYRYYDIQEATKIANRDGWGCPHFTAEHRTTQTLPHASAREMAACAADADFRRLRGWCHDDWYWQGIIVTRQDTGEKESLWGIESDTDGYEVEVAYELAAELIDDDADREAFEAARVIAPWPDVR